MDTSDENGNALPAGYEFEGYKIESILGEGGFGITYLAVKTNKIGLPVAIKEYFPRQFARRDPSSLAVRPVSAEDRHWLEWGLRRFLTEAQELVKLRDHPNIVHAIDYVEAHDTAYIVMDYVKGESLGSIIRRTGALSEVEILEILIPLLDGLEAVHNAEKIHRDIKPDNIYIRQDGQPVLLDFGAVARQAMRDNPEMSYTEIVAEGFSPPEQYSRKGNQGRWTDIYALGATLYKCMTGKAPPSALDRMTTERDGASDSVFREAKVAKRRYSKRLVDAVEAALRLRERERPQNITAFRALLPATEHHPTPRFRWIRYAGAAAALAALAIVAYVTLVPSLSAPHPTVVRIIEDGRGALRHGKYVAAGQARRDATRTARNLPNAPPGSPVAIASLGVVEVYRRELIEHTSRFFREVDAAIQRRDLDTADSKIAAALELFPNTSAELEPERKRLTSFLLDYGRAELKKGSIEAAARAAKMVERIDPNNAALAALKSEIAPELERLVEQPLRLIEIAPIDRRSSLSKYLAGPSQRVLRQATEPGLISDAVTRILEKIKRTIEGRDRAIGLLKSAYEALARKDCDTAKRLTSQAEEADNGAADYVALRREIDKTCVIQDCQGCPELVVIPPGTFVMGSPEREPDRFKEDGPQRRITVSKAFALAKTEVTVGQFKSFVSDADYKIEGKCWIWDPVSLSGLDVLYASWRDPDFDMVAFGRMIRHDESGTVSAMMACQRDLLEPTVLRNHGHVFKFVGDGFLSEFENPVDAVKCAVEIQQSVGHRSFGSSQKRVAFRIGVHAGEIIVKGGDCFGDVVNIASRLQRLAPPHGVCVSALVHHQLQGKLPLPFEDMGERRVKHISELLHLYSIRVVPTA